MSVDIKIQNKCDHYINWESLSFNSDQRSIYVSYLIAAAASVSLRINNVIIPSTEYVVSKGAIDPITNTAFFLYTSWKNRLWQPLVEVRYATIARYCPKCLNVSTIDDWSYEASGDVRVCEKEYLLVQNVEKYIITQVSSNPFHKWMGTSLHSMIGSKVIDQESTVRSITEQISGALDKLRSIQDQLQGTSRKIDPGEILDKVLGIEVTQTADPTMYEAVVSFTAKSGSSLKYTQFIELSPFRERRVYV